jgi:hypothetical protein
MRHLKSHWVRLMLNVKAMDNQTIINRTQANKREKMWKGVKK